MGEVDSGKPGPEGANTFPGKADPGLRGIMDPNRVCNFCFGKGHWRNECLVLKTKLKPGFLPPKPSGAAVSLRGEERDRAIAAVRAHTKPSLVESMFEDPGLDQELTGSPTHQEMDPGYAAFVSDGFVSLVGSETKIPVKILRDSGALESFIVESVFNLSPETDTGSSAAARGMGLAIFSAPKHKLTELKFGER